MIDAAIAVDVIVVVNVCVGAVTAVVVVTTPTFEFMLITSTGVRSNVISFSRLSLKFKCLEFLLSVFFFFLLGVFTIPCGCSKLHEFVLDLVAGLIGGGGGGSEGERMGLGIRDNSGGEGDFTDSNDSSVHGIDIEIDELSDSVFMTLLGEVVFAVAKISECL